MNYYLSAVFKWGWCILVCLGCCADARGASPRHYVFFNMDRERISEATFLDTKAFEGAQLKYTWRQLEHGKDGYEFADVQHDWAFLKSKGKKLFIQIQDASFDINIRPFPRYLLQDPAYRGGADKQYGDDNVPYGWMARRWDKAVQERFHRLILALGREFDGRIEGINLAETAFDVAPDKRLWPEGFSPETYCDAIITNMVVLKRAFPKSVAIQYANFMPGDRRYLEKVYQRAKELKVGLGGPDLLPYKFFQMENSYPLLKGCAGSVPTGIAVQDGNYEHTNPKTGRQVTIAELISFAADYLKVDYIFWCTQEPFYSKSLIPFLEAQQ
jgi:hypothetical protein